MSSIVIPPSTKNLVREFQQTYLLDQITHEQELRKRLKEEIDICDKLTENYAKFLETKEATEIAFNNEDKDETYHERVVKSFMILQKNPKHYFQYKHNMEKNLKKCIHSEKFFRYVYNHNLSKAKEYHDKISNYWNEELETVMEESRNGRGVKLLLTTKKPECKMVNEADGEEYSKNDDAVRQLGDKMKEEYETRQMCLKYVTMILEKSILYQSGVDV